MLAKWLGSWGQKGREGQKRGAVPRCGGAVSGRWRGAAAAGWGWWGWGGGGQTGEAARALASKREGGEVAQHTTHLKSG